MSGYPQISLIDTHCHLDFDEFDHDREAVIADCKTQNIDHIIVPGVSQRNWSKTRTVCSQYENLHCALGMHPVFIEEHQPQHLVELEEQANQSDLVAIGEIGLDYRPQFTDNGRKEKQRLFFSKQLLIAKKTQLPVIIHCLKAHDDCISLLTEHKVSGGIIHAFNGSIQQAEKYIELGFCLGFGGMLTYERSRVLRNLALQIPLENIVLETDAPDMTVSQHRGQRNSPAYLPYVLSALANIKTTNETKISETTSQNARRVFGKSIT